MGPWERVVRSRRDILAWCRISPRWYLLLSEDALVHSSVMPNTEHFEFSALNRQCSSPRDTRRVATPDQGIDVPLSYLKMISLKPSSPQALMWARVAELRIDIRLTEFCVCLTQTSRKENKSISILLLNKQTYSSLSTPRITYTQQTKATRVPRSNPLLLI